MQIIYIAHSKELDYKNKLYLPLRNSSLNKQFNIILPHETEKFINSKEIIKNSSFVIAEVSYSATGLGIELGWADVFNVLILAIYMEGSMVSGSISAVADSTKSYKNSNEMLENIMVFINNYEKLHAAKNN
jgi:hypothetical protein